MYSRITGPHYQRGFPSSHASITTYRSRSRSTSRKWCATCTTCGWCTAPVWPSMSSVTWHFGLSPRNKLRRARQRPMRQKISPFRSSGWVFSRHAQCAGTFPPIARSKLTLRSIFSFSSSYSFSKSVGSCSWRLACPVWATVAGHVPSTHWARPVVWLAALFQWFRRWCSPSPWFSPSSCCAKCTRFMGQRAPHLPRRWTRARAQ